MLIPLVIVFPFHLLASCAAQPIIVSELSPDTDLNKLWELTLKREEKWN